MRKTPLLAFVGLFLVIGVRSASADTVTTGNLSFTGFPGDTLPTAGSFVYDNTTNQFLNIVIDWDGFRFDTFESLSVQGPVGAQILVEDPTVQRIIYAELLGLGPLPMRWEALCGFSPVSIPFCDTLDFGFEDLGSGGKSAIDFQSPVGVVPEFLPAGGAGFVTATDLVTTPEPGATALLLLGIGVLLAVKKSALISYLQAVRTDRRFQVF